MEVQALIDAARGGENPRPVHVVVGTETFLIERCVSLLRSVCLGDEATGFNDDLFHGKGLDAGAVLAAARTLPMFASARFVLVRGAGDASSEALDKLVPYVEAPAPSTCLLITAQKLDGRSRFVKAAKKTGAFTDAAPFKPGALRGFVGAEAKRRGHSLDSRAAEALVDAIGTDLSALDDALERLSLFVGEAASIDLASVEACVTKVRVESIWGLVDAVGMRDARHAMHAASSLLSDREPPLKILAMMARQLRMVGRMREALASGLRGPEAAKAAGAPPFKVRDLTEAARRFTMRDLAYAFQVLAETDLALKGSKAQPDAVLQTAILRLCRPEAF